MEVPMDVQTGRYKAVLMADRLDASSGILAKVCESEGWAGSFPDTAAGTPYKARASAAYLLKDGPPFHNLHFLGDVPSSPCAHFSW